MLFPASICISFLKYTYFLSRIFLNTFNQLWFQCETVHHETVRPNSYNTSADMALVDCTNQTLPW
jgi:hypothetical protein